MAPPTRRHAGKATHVVAAHWAQRHHWSDLGMPEGLAYKIAVFEAVAREDGFIIKTARIRGLDCERAWDDARQAEAPPHETQVVSGG